LILLPSLSLFSMSLLFALLGAAVWHDVRARRVPNAVVFPGALAALLLHALAAAGDGLFGTPAGGLGLVSAFGGLAIGLAFLLPLYALRLMGAGDVKLLAMVGTFVGAGQILSIAILTLLAGGVLALVYAAHQGKLRQVLGNTYQMIFASSMAALAGHIEVAPPAAASGRLPYALAIAGATVPCVVWLHLTGTMPL
jgi:prepilin peptidase CpaA